jgi:hypothetical protein
VYREGEALIREKKMNIDKIEMEKKAITNAFNEVKKLGVKFSTKNYEFYSFTKEGCYLVGVYKGSEKKQFKNGDKVLHIFDVKKAVLLNKKDELVEVENSIVGVFSSSRLDYMLNHTFNIKTKKMEEVDRKGKMLAIVYTGIENVKTKAGKELQVHNFYIKELSL